MTVSIPAAVPGKLVRKVRQGTGDHDLRTDFRDVLVRRVAAGRATAGNVIAFPHDQPRLRVCLTIELTDGQLGRPSYQPCS